MSLGPERFGRGAFETGCPVLDGQVLPAEASRANAASNGAGPVPDADKLAFWDAYYAPARAAARA